ncbi:MAG: hypothetical protein ACJAT7_001294 [Psychromonas sp.]|jgi:hypothetical protein
MKLAGISKIFDIKVSVSLGDALNLGLMHCSNEFITRMDTDGIASLERFEK